MPGIATLLDISCPQTFAKLDVFSSKSLIKLDMSNIRAKKIYSPFRDLFLLQLLMRLPVFT
jgi:hypothetical protein